MNAFLAGALGALTVIVVLFLATALVHAAHRRRRARFHPRRALAFLFRGLGVREEQRERLAPEADALAEELARLRVDARALRVEIASLLAAPTFDPAALRGALDRPFTRLARCAPASRRRSRACTRRSSPRSASRSPSGSGAGPRRTAELALAPDRRRERRRRAVEPTRHLRLERVEVVAGARIRRRRR